MTDNDVVIRSLDVRKAGAAELRGFYQLGVAAAPDWSDLPTPDYETAITALRRAEPGFGDIVRHLATRGDDVVGYAKAQFPEHENTDLSLVEITVHPAARGHGIGTELLRSVLVEVAARGRVVVEGWAVKRGGPGERWALDLGFRPVHETVIQRLDLSAVDPSVWEVGEPAGYRLTSWQDAVPDEFLESFAHTRTAIDDAPLGDAAFENPRWTPERVRAAEEDVRRSGLVSRVVAAVCERDSQIVGFTEVEAQDMRDDVADQGETAVLAEHRGHGLGIAMKSRMAAWLRIDRPALRYVLTGTASSNTHMIRVNQAIGYLTMRTTVVLDGDVAALRERLMS